MITSCPSCLSPLADVERSAEVVQCSICGETIDLNTGVTLAPADATLKEPDRPPVAVEEPPTAKRFGDYEILEKIGEGAMGFVFKARHIPLDRTLAIKMIKSGEFAAREDLERFRTEATAAARLDHPNIVPVYEFGESNDQHFFTMGYVEGGNLKLKLADGPLGSRESAALMQVIADAIQYAHERGVVHRDLKPTNILIDREGNPRVADFGLAKRTEADSELTATGQILGTPSYMPPEQARGEVVGPYSDVYSLGAVLYQLLTGRPPFHAGNAMDTIRQVLDDEPTSPRRLNPRIDPDIETICLKCLEKDAARRYGSAAELSADLKRYLNHEPIAARRATMWHRGWKWIRRHPATTTIAALLLAGGIGVGVLVAQYEEQNQAQQAERAKEREELEKLRKQLDALSSQLNRTSGDLFNQTLSAEHLDAQDAARLARSLDQQEKLLAVLTARVDEKNRSEENVAALATSQLNVGALKLRLSRDGADVALRAAKENFEDLVKRFPNETEYLRARLIADYNIASFHAVKGQYHIAMRYLDAALKDVTKVQKGNADQLAARLHLDAGLCAARLNNLRQAEPLFLRAEALLDEQIKQTPNDSLPRQRMGRVLFSLALLNVRNGRYLPARNYYQRAVDLQKSLVKANPSSHVLRSELVRSLTNRGQLLWQLRDFNTARRQFEQAVEEGRLLAKIRPIDSAYADKGIATYHFASFKFSQNDKQGAESLLRECLTAFAKLKARLDMPTASFASKTIVKAASSGHSDKKVAFDPFQSNPELKLAILRKLRQEARMALLDLEYHKGNYNEAFDLLQLIVPNFGREPNRFATSAKYCARFATAAAADTTLKAPQRQQTIDKYAKHAAEYLKKAQMLGYKQFDTLLAGPEWKVLRNRPEIRSYATPD